MKNGFTETYGPASIVDGGIGIEVSVESTPDNEGAYTTLVVIEQNGNHIEMTFTQAEQIKKLALDSILKAAAK